MAGKNNHRICRIEKACDNFKYIMKRLENKVAVAGAAVIALFLASDDSGWLTGDACRCSFYCNGKHHLSAYCIIGSLDYNTTLIT